MIPTILCFIDNKKVDAIEGLDDLGGYTRPGSDSVGWFCLFGVVGLLLCVVFMFSVSLTLPSRMNTRPPQVGKLFDRGDDLAPWPERRD